MDPPSSHDRTVNTTPKAYKWRQPASDNGSDAAGDNHSMSSFSQHSVSPTDVRLLFPIAPAHTHCPRPHVHADGSVASAASLSVNNNNNNNNAHQQSSSSAGTNTMSLLSINSSFATAPQTEDDLSSMDDNERYDSSSQQESTQSQSQSQPSMYSRSSCCSVSSSSQSSSAQQQQQQQQQQQRVVYAKALPPLDSDESNSDDQHSSHHHYLGVGSLKEFHILTKSPHKFGTSSSSSSHKKSSKSKKSSSGNSSSRDPSGKKLKGSSSKDPKKQKARKLKPRTSTATSSSRSSSASASIGTSSRGSGSSGMQVSTSSSRGSSRSSRSYTSSGILKPRAKMVTQATQTSPQSIERVLYVSTSSALHPAHRPLPHPEEQHPSKKVEVDMDQHPSKNLENPQSRLQSQQPPPPPLHAPPTTTATTNIPSDKNHTSISPGDSPLYQHHKSTSTSTTSVGIGTHTNNIQYDDPVTPRRKTSANHHPTSNMLAIDNDDPKHSNNDNNLDTIDDDNDNMDESFVTARGTPSLDVSLVEQIINDMTPRKKGSSSSASSPHSSNEPSFETVLNVTITEPEEDDTQVITMLRDDEPSFATALDVTLIEPEDDDDSNDNSAADTTANHGPIIVEPLRVSGRVVGGTWNDSDGIFLDENNDEYMNLSLDTSVNTSNANDKSLSMIMEDSQQETSLNGTPYQTQQQSPYYGVAVVSPQASSGQGEGCDDMSFESAAATGDWKRDLLATRLNFDDKLTPAKVTPPAVVETRRHEDTTEQPSLRSQTSSSSVTAFSGKDGIASGSSETVINRARSADSDDDHEILVEPRRSRKPVVLKGPLRENMRQTNLSWDESQGEYASKASVPRETASLTVKHSLSNIVVPRETAPKTHEITVAPRKSKPLVLQGNLKEYMVNTSLLFQSKDDLALLPQQRRQLSRKEIVVEPQRGRESQVWSGNVKEIMPMGDDGNNEIEVQPRYSKPVVLRGNLNECMDNVNLLFQSQDDLHVLPRFQLKKHLSVLDIAVAPFESNTRRLLSDNVTDIMPLDEASNEISINARQSESVVLHDDMKDNMGKAGLVFQSNGNLAALEKGKEASSENEEIQASEDGVVSGDLRDYFDDAAVAFQESVRQSTNEIHDVTVTSPLDEIGEEANDAYVMDTSSIVSLQEELALADRSFEVELGSMSVTSDEVTVPTKNLDAYPVSPEEAVIKRRAKVVHLPFPWCSPELLFVPHNELKPPPEAMKFELPTPPINEEEELSDVENSESESLDLESSSHDTANDSPQRAAADAINEAAVRATTGLDDEGQPVPVSPDDVAVLYRGDEPPDFSKRKRSLVRLMRSFSTRNSCVGDPFCTDCGGPLTKCGCEHSDEDDADRSTRAKSVYSVDVGRVVPDSSAKFLMVKVASTASRTKKQKKKKKQRTRQAPTTDLRNSKESNLAVVKESDNLIAKTEDLEKSAERNATVEFDSDLLIAKAEKIEKHREADVTAVIDVDDFIAESERLEKVSPLVESKAQHSKERNVTAIIDVDDFIAESERLATNESLDMERESPYSATLLTADKVVDNNAIVPHPPRDPSLSDIGAMEEETESVSVEFKKLPAPDKAVAVQDPSDVSVEPSSVKSGAGSIKFVKVGKKVDAGVCCVEDPPPRPKKKKKIFRGIRKKVGSLVKRIKGTRAKI